MKKAICLVVVLSVLLGTASCSKEASDPSVSNPVIGPDNQGSGTMRKQQLLRV